jgi:hypothetical protein
VNKAINPRCKNGNARICKSKCQIVKNRYTAFVHQSTSSHPRSIPYSKAVDCRPSRRQTSPHVLCRTAYSLHNRCVAGCARGAVWPGRTSALPHAAGRASQVHRPPPAPATSAHTFSLSHSCTILHKERAPHARRTRRSTHKTTRNARRKLGNARPFRSPQVELLSPPVRPARKRVNISCGS